MEIIFMGRIKDKSGFKVNFDKSDNNKHYTGVGSSTQAKVRQQEFTDTPLVYDTDETKRRKTLDEMSLA